MKASYASLRWTTVRPQNILNTRYTYRTAPAGRKVVHCCSGLRVCSVVVVVEVVEDGECAANAQADAS